MLVLGPFYETPKETLKKYLITFRVLEPTRNPILIKAVSQIAFTIVHFVYLLDLKVESLDEKNVTTSNSSLRIIKKL